MKTKITFILLLIAGLVNAQNGFNYKALITNNGNVLSNHNVTIKFTILENGTTAVYQETQTATTDANGIVSVALGEGTPVSGNFSSINWSNPQSLKVEINTGSGYHNFGTSELKYVPVSKYADKANDVNKIKGIPVSSTAPTNGQVLKFNGSEYVPASDDVSGGSGTDGVVNSASFSGSTTKTLTLTRSNGLGNITATFTDNVNDTDHDPTNEIDADFYKAGTTNPPTSINDNIFTKGKLGIGINNPTVELDIKKVGGDPTIKLTNSSASKHAWISRFTNRLNINADDKIQFGTGGQTDADVTIDSNGHVGIGTGSPIGRLNVIPIGNLAAGSSPPNINNAGLYVGNTTEGIAFDSNQIETKGSKLHLNYNSTYDITMVHGGGKVGIGTASPRGTLEINTGTTNNTKALVLSQGDSYAAVSRIKYQGDILTFTNTADRGSNLSTFIYKNYDNDNIVKISQFGDMAVGKWADYNGTAYSLNLATTRRGIADAWFTYSDSRLKTNKQDLDYGLQTIMQIKPKRYLQHGGHLKNGKVKYRDNEIKPVNNIGFIAQELYKIVPEAVDKPEDENKYFWAINYEKIIPILVKAIQEQQEKINELEQEIQKLTNK